MQTRVNYDPYAGTRTCTCVNVNPASALGMPHDDDDDHDTCNYCTLSTTF